MQIESLHDRRRDDRIAADVIHKLYLVFHSFLTADAVSRAFEREVEWKFVEEADDARTLVDADAGQLSNTNARVFQRRHLRAREEVEAVLVVVLIYEDLRRLF